MSGYNKIVRNPSLTYNSNQSSLHLNDYPSSRAETPINDTRQAVPHVRTLSETLQLFQSAVDSSRAAAVKSNAESEAMESSISLNVDLKNKNLGLLPDEVVDVMKKDHGRYVYICSNISFEGRP